MYLDFNIAAAATATAFAFAMILENGRLPVLSINGPTATPAGAVALIFPNQAIGDGTVALGAFAERVNAAS